MSDDPAVDEALQILRAGAHDAWVTLHPVGEAKQRELVGKMLAAERPKTVSEAVFWGEVKTLAETRHNSDRPCIACFLETVKKHGWIR